MAINVNPDSSSDIVYRLETLERTIDQLKTNINALKLNEQFKLQKNDAIPPGIATKVAYDENGLVVKGYKLEASDIPNINIESVINLKEELDKKVGAAAIANLESSLEQVRSSIINSGEVVASGTKVNIDKHGFVVDVLNLLEEDIPDLSIDKIIGLRDELEVLKNNTKIEEVKVDQKTISPGVYTKIHYDEYGKVIKGENLSLEDIPMELVGKINILENKIVSLAQASVVDGLLKEVHKKLDANDEYVKPGTFTKVRIDDKGLVTRGDKLSIEDLPDITIKDIQGLDSILKTKANSEDIISLNDLVSGIVSTLDRVGDITSLKTEVKSKANDSEVKNIQNDIQHLKSLLNNLTDRIPNDTILEELKELNRSISNLEGRVDIIERKMNVE